MKILFVLFVLVALVCNISAQGHKGLKELGGSLRYASSNQDEWVYHYGSNIEVKSQVFEIQPKIGWFINESSVVGIGLGYEFEKQSYGKDSETKSNNFLISPYYRNYQNIAGSFYYTTTVSFSVGFGNATTSGDAKFKGFGYELLVAPGINYFISEKWAVKANFGGLYYQKNEINSEEEGDDANHKSSGFGIDLSMDSFSLGASFYF